MSNDSEAAIQQHYERADLTSRVLSAIRDAGLSLEQLKPDDLAAVDEFHIRGREATQELAKLARLQEGDKVLDVGSGLGGTARYLAETFGCRVTGVDVTPAYCDLARELSKAAGLTRQTQFECVNALAMPFEEAAFDVVWTEHLQMNVQDKLGLYRQIERVLKPDGQLVFHEIFGNGESAPSAFPVPWAEGPEISFLAPPADVDDLLRQLCFEPVIWEDRTKASLRWFEALKERLAAEGAPPLGLHLLMGESAKQKLVNMGQSLRDGRLRVVQAVYRKPKK